MEAITARISRMLAPHPGLMTLDGTNTLILRAADGDASVVIDPGPLENGHVDALAEIGPIAAIILTHGHFDHCESAPRLRELSGAPVIARDAKLCLGADPIPDAPGRSVIAGLDWLTVL